MDNTEDIIQIKFTGNNIKPDSVSIQDFVSVLAAFEKSLRAVVEHNNPNLDIEDDYISLIDIENRSLSLVLKLREDQLVVNESYKQFTKSLDSNQFDLLPIASVDELKKITTFNQRYQCKMQLGYGSNGNFVRMGEFKQYKPHKLKSFRDKKTIYGELIKIGGDKPKAYIQQYNGTVINGSLSKEMAVNYSGLLYKKVKAFGVVVVSGKTLTPVSFKVNEIAPFEPLSLQDSIDSIKNALID